MLPGPGTRAGGNDAETVSARSREFYSKARDEESETSWTVALISAGARLHPFLRRVCVSVHCWATSVLSVARQLSGLRHCSPSVAAAANSDHVSQRVGVFCASEVLI